MTYRSKTPQHRIAVLGAALMAITTDMQAATSGSKLNTCFDADKDFTNGKGNVSNGDSCMAAASPMTTLQMQVDTAGAAPTHKATATKNARTFEINGLGVKKATCIGIDGVGVPGAAAKKAMDEAGVIDFGSASCEGMAPLALVAASAKGKVGMATARRHRGSQGGRPLGPRLAWQENPRFF